MATSRRMPIAFNEKTFGAAGFGRDYTSVATWEAVTDVNCVSNAKGEVLTGYADQATFVQTASVTWDGATTNSNYFRVFRAASGAEPLGRAGRSGSLQLTGDNIGGFYNLYDNYDAIHDIEFTQTNGASLSILVRCVNDGQRIVGCIGKNNNTNCYGFASFSTGASTVHRFINCGVYDTPFGFLTTLFSQAHNLIIDNCTALDCSGAGYFQFSPTVVDATNCIAKNSSNFSTLNSAVTCTTGAVVFEDEANHDLRLGAADTVAKDNGTDRSAVFDDDCLLATRSDGNWDIGMHEYVASTTFTPRCTMIL